MYGHQHLNVTSIDAHRRFWVDTLGGASIRVGTAPAEVFRFPNVLIFMNERPPTGGTKGSTVNHVGFQVPDLRATVDRLREAGYPIVTRAELPARYDVKDDLAFIPDQNATVAFVMAPDETKVEFIENRSMSGSIALHHIHFAAPDVEAMRAWYVKTFGAKPGNRGALATADLPGVNLTYSAAPAAVVGTHGRAIDRVGFEIEHLEEFCRRLESSGVTLNLPYTQAPGSNLAAACITDPWGTYIELTEGLGTVA